MPILCEIVTQERMLFSEPVDMVIADGAEGRLGILPHHVPLLTSLKISELIVKQQGNERSFSIGGGVLDVQPDKVTVLADVAEAAEEVDIQRAEAARERAAAMLQSDIDHSSRAGDEYANLSHALMRAQVRLRVGYRAKRHLPNF